MTFQLETEMLEPAVRWLEAEGLRTKTEFITPWGICDLLGVALNQENAELRLSRGQRKPLARPARIALLNHIPEETFITLPRLERELAPWLSPHDLREELQRLQAWHYLATPRRNSFQKLNGWAPLHDRIVALELKLSRIEEALAQATANLKLTPESYVGLPSPTARRILEGPRRTEFRKLGVGLLSINHGRCEVLIPPAAPRETVDPVFEAYCVERFWSAWITDSSA